MTTQKSEFSFYHNHHRSLFEAPVVSAGVIRPSIAALTTSRPRPPTGRSGTLLRLWRALPHVHRRAINVGAATSNMVGCGRVVLVCGLPPAVARCIARV